MILTNAFSTIQMIVCKHYKMFIVLLLYVKRSSIYTAIINKKIRINLCLKSC